MRRLVALALVGCSWFVNPLRAGVYCPDEPPLGPAEGKGPVTAMPYGLFKSRLTDSINLAYPTLQTAWRTQGEQRRKELETKQRAGRATLDEQITLSAWQIRFRDYGAAIELLTPLAAQHRDHYLVLANLITAYQLNGHLDRAMSLLGSLRGGKPSVPGWSPEQTAWLVRADEYQHKLIRLRYRESLGQRGGGAPVAPTTVDDLFGVRFVGPSGEYEAGQLAPAQKAKLPPDALALVQQLVLWLPDDARLYWLLGEIYNAQGDLVNANKVFVDSRWEGNRRLDAPELRAHRQIVQDALAKAPPVPDVQDNIALPGDTANTDEPAHWWPSTRQFVLVGGVGGLFILVFVYLQIREFRRRAGKPTGC